VWYGTACGRAQHVSSRAVGGRALHVSSRAVHLRSKAGHGRLQQVRSKFRAWQDRLEYGRSIG
jgi:hypothetical protein